MTDEPTDIVVVGLDDDGRNFIFTSLGGDKDTIARQLMEATDGLGCAYVVSRGVCPCCASIAVLHRALIGAQLAGAIITEYRCDCGLATRIRGDAAAGRVFLPGVAAADS